MKKTKVAIVRGKFLNKYEMQSFEKLSKEYDLTGIGSLFPIHDKFTFPVKKTPSPTDLPEFPYKMPVLNRIFKDANYLLGLEKIIEGFDIAHSAETYYHFTWQCLEAKKRGMVKKVIATVFENIPFNNEGIRGRREFKKRAINELDHIITATYLAKEALMLEGALPSKISVIGHGVDTKIFKPKYQERSKAEINILFVGRIEYYKGIYEILFAAKNLLADQDLKKYKIKFTFVGNGTEKINFIKEERKLEIDSNFIHKYVPYEKMPDEYQQADILLVPSKPTRFWQEQFCDVLMEGQACGLPIIATRTGSIEENVGDAAVLIEAGNYLSLAKEIKNMILNPKLRFAYGQKARKRALAVHDSFIIAKKLSRVYEKVLSL